MKKAVITGLLALMACADGAPLSMAEEGSWSIPRPFSVQVAPGVEIGGMQVGRGGRPLVVIHGGPGMDHRYLRPALDALADSHWVIYVDQRGTGLSEMEVSSELINFSALVDDVDRVRKWAGTEQVDVLAHSWGTVLALHYAERYPDAVNRMVLVSPTEPGNRFQGQAMARRNQRVDPRDRTRLAELAASEAFQRGETATISRYYELVFKPILHEASAPIRIPLDPGTARNGFAVMNALGGTMPNPDYWDKLSSITVPILLVQGAADAYPKEMVREMASTLGNGRVLLLEEAGHFPYIEMPGAFFDGVRAFLDPSGES